LLIISIVVDIAMITMATASTTTAQIGTAPDEDPAGSVITTALVVVVVAVDVWVWVMFSQLTVTVLKVAFVKFVKFAFTAYPVPLLSQSVVL